MTEQTAGFQKNTGFKRIIKAAHYSYKGLRHGVCHEAALRQEFFAAIVLIPLALFLDLSYIDKIMLVAAVVFVFIVELLNTAVEVVVDRVGLELHELSGRAKDLGSAAVLVSLMLASSIWVTVLWVNFA